MLPEVKAKEAEERQRAEEEREKLQELLKASLCGFVVYVGVWWRWGATREGPLHCHKARARAGKPAACRGRQAADHRQCPWVLRVQGGKVPKALKELIEEEEEEKADMELQVLSCVCLCVCVRGCACYSRLGPGSPEARISTSAAMRFTQRYHLTAAPTPPSSHTHLLLADPCSQNQTDGGPWRGEDQVHPAQD